MSDGQWNHVELGDVFRINSEPVLPGSMPHQMYFHHSIPAFDETGGCVVEPGAAIESNKTLINRPSVLVSKLNPRKPRVSLVMPENGEVHCCSTEFICYQPKSAHELVEFWRLYFASTLFSKRLERVAVGSTNSHTRASPKETLRWLVPNPPEWEKRAIAGVLDTLDTQIQKTEAIISKLQQVKQGLLHDLLTRGIDANGQLRPSREQAPELYKESPLGWIPKEWEALKLDELAESIIDGPFGSNLKTEHYVESDGVRVVRLQNIQVGDYDDDDPAFISFEHAAKLSRHTVTTGDLLIASLGDTSNPVGRACIYPPSLPNAVNKADCFRFRSKGFCSNEYVMLALNSESSRRQVGSFEQGVTLKRINIGNLRKVVIPVPRNDEQVGICKRYESINGQLKAMRHEVTKLRVEKNGLMDDLLTGRVRVNHLTSQQTAS